MNRNYVIVAVVAVVLVLVFSMMRSSGEDAVGEETAPAATTD